MDTSNSSWNGLPVRLIPAIRSYGRIWRITLQKATCNHVRDKQVSAEILVQLIVKCLLTGGTLPQTWVKSEQEEHLYLPKIAYVSVEVG